MSFGWVPSVVKSTGTLDNVPRTTLDVVAQIHLLAALVPTENHLEKMMSYHEFPYLTRDVDVELMGS